MMKSLFLLVLGIWSQIGFACPIIPYPKKCEATDDIFVLKNNVQIQDAETDMGAFLQSRLYPTD